MNILFIYPVAYAASYQEGIASISAVLKQAGHQVKLLICNRLDKLYKLTISAYILNFRPQMVLIHCMTNQFPLAKMIVDYTFK